MTDGNDAPEASDDDAPEEEATEEEATEEEATEEDATEKEATEEESVELSADTLASRLDDAEAALEDAETEADLDGVEADLDAIAEDLEAADLPAPDEDDEDDEDAEDAEDAEDPRAELEDRLEALRADLEEARGPYAEDVAGTVEDVASDVAAADWTEQGVAELGGAVESFAATVEETVGTDVDVAVDDPDFDDEPMVAGGRLADLRSSIEAAGEAVTDAGLDPDEDEEAIATLLAAAEQLEADVEAATAWSDLSVREQLDAHGYYDVLDHRKDYPPEWGALKVWEKRDRADMVLLALKKFESDFMEEHCLAALERMAPEEALDEMVDMAQKRNRDAIGILGKIGSDEPVEGLLNYVGEDNDTLLRRATLKALGEIGSEEATQGVANAVAAEDAAVRSQAARSLGLIGDTRAIDPLADVLADDDDDQVRASAAWALNQVGTERAREVVADYDDDRAYVVQTEAEKVA
jgi:HEAT repeat protein